MAAVLPLDDVVNVIINLSPRSAVRNGFNLSMLLCDSPVLDATNRVQVFSSLASMQDAGFTADMPEYKAAQIYFSQSSKPGKVAIGFWDSKNESLAEAIAACRVANREWYGVAPLGSVQGGVFAPPTSADIISAAGAVEAAVPSTVMFATVTNETMTTLKSLSYRRTLGVVSTNNDIAVGILGWAMGANTGLARSAYTLKFKKIVGVLVDQLSEAQVSDAKASWGNVYINRGATYDWFEDGTMADGTWFDEMINLDMLANNVQLSVCDLLNKTNKVPQTEAGMLEIINSFTPDLEKAVRTGFVAPGIWTAPGLLTLEQGDAIEKGYLVMSEPINDQVPAEREARMAPPIYIMLKLAGAIHYVVIQINVNR
jgi:hypothetical protein